MSDKDSSAGEPILQPTLRSPADRPIILLGYRATGKSTLAPKLATALSQIEPQKPWRAIDTDRRVEEAVGCRVSDYFSSHGEPAFRRAETAALREVLQPRRVIATGGGIVVTSANRRLLTGHFCVLLTAPPAILYDRLSGRASRQARPALTDLDLRSEIEEKLAERMPWYEELATLTIDTRRLRVRAAVTAIVEAYQEK